VRHGNFCDRARLRFTQLTERSCADVLSRGQPHPNRDPQGRSALRAQADLLNRIKLMLPVQSPFAKIFPFPSDPNHLHISRHPSPHEGAFRDRHERRVGMRWTRVALLTRAHPCGRRSRVVLTPRRWRQASQRQLREATVANKPGHRLSNAHF
jgi:hypothetical protein